MRLRLALIAAFVVLLIAGAGAAVLLTMRDEPGGALDTELAGVSVSVAPDLPVRPTPEPEPTADKLCWPFFGGDPQRSLSRPDQHLGLPARKSLWARGMGAYMEYPPSYCDGMLYVSTFAGETFALDAETGKVKWKRRAGGPIASTPAIAGDRVIVSSHDGTVTALDRANGKPLWQVRTRREGRVVTGRRRRPRVLRLDRRAAVRRRARHRAGALGIRHRRADQCEPVRLGAAGVHHDVRRVGLLPAQDAPARSSGARTSQRDSFRNESFYASPSTDGRRLYTVARSGKVVALDARDGDIVWTGRVGGLGYTTPAVAHGSVFVGGFDGRLRAYRAGDRPGAVADLVGGRILGAPVVIGDLVFFATLEQRTYAARVSDGRIVWQLPMGKYSPVIATERTYFFSANGILAAFRGRDASPRQGPARLDGGMAASPKR